MLHILTIRVAKFHEIALYKLAQGLTGVVIRSKSQISLGRSIDYLVCTIEPTLDYDYKMGISSNCTHPDY